MAVSERGAAAGPLVRSAAETRNAFVPLWSHRHSSSSGGQHLPLFSMQLFFRVRLAVLVGVMASSSFAAELDTPRANARTIENLATFARAYGYIRFFHPTDAAAAADWDRIAIAGVEAVVEARDDEGLRRAMADFFAPLGHGVQFLGARDAPANGGPDTQTGQRVTYWQHLGVRLSERSKIYLSRRVLSGVANRDAVFDAPVPSPGFVEKPLSHAIRLVLPLVLAVNDDHKTPASAPEASSVFEKHLAAIDLTALPVTDWRLRAAGIIATWNVFQHFHPYIDRVGVKWEETLRPALQRTLGDRDRLAYHATLSELVAHLQDGHGYVSGLDVQMGGLPLRVDVVENEIVVTGAAPDQPFRKGDVVVSIDGMRALTLLSDRERYVSGSPHLRRYRALNQYGEGPFGSTARIELLRGGEQQTIEHVRARDRRGFFFNSIGEFEFPAFAEVRPGIFYVNLPAITVAGLAEKLPQLASARGVIFDERWDGRMPASQKPEDRVSPHQHVIPHLTDQTVHASPMLIPRITLPDREGWTYRESTWPVAPKTPRIGGRVVFINVPAVVSYGETCMAMIAHHKLATLVGESTAGCNGNVNFIELPGGFRIMWTGMEVLKLDRSPFYGVGFVPDHPVSRTLEAVRQGRDEFLEKAIEVIERTPRI